MKSFISSFLLKLITFYHSFLKRIFQFFRVGTRSSQSQGNFKKRNAFLNTRKFFALRPQQQNRTILWYSWWSLSILSVKTCQCLTPQRIVGQMGKVKFLSKPICDLARVMQINWLQLFNNWLLTNTKTKTVTKRRAKTRADGQGYRQDPQTQSKFVQGQINEVQAFQMIHKYTDQ